MRSHISPTRQPRFRTGHVIPVDGSDVHHKDANLDGARAVFRHEEVRADSERRSPRGQDSPGEQTGFEPPVPLQREGAERSTKPSRQAGFLWRGANGSHPPSSASESVSLGNFSIVGEVARLSPGRKAGGIEPAAPPPIIAQAQARWCRSWCGATSWLATCCCSGERLA
jgi:hypothetical protein